MSIFSIPLDIPDVEVINVEQDQPILLRHLPIFDQPVYLKIHPVRYQCLDCKNDPTTTQKLPWYSPRRPNTLAYENYILRQLINSTVTDVHHKERVGNGAIEGIVDRHILAMLKDRKKVTVKAFLQSIPPKLVETIVSYCCDA